MDFARKELLSLLYELPEVGTEVASDFADLEALGRADLLVTYTCDLRPSDAEQEALAGFVRGGGRWFALHGTNSVLEFLKEGVKAPRSHDVLMHTLGSRFLAHPPIQRFEVRVADPEHPLVHGIEPFSVEDEIYLCEYHGAVQPLLETSFSGEAPGFVESQWHDDAPRPVLYLHPEGEGEVLYLTLGHCRGRYDMRPLMDAYPRLERGAWESPIFYDLLRRGLRWAAGT
jgi:type 1 glutamine amidotransferase